ncbi:MAG: hypothetical protein NDJ89_11265 [Oligoflexia bacterium]|nr:hypothetical protein [Oligoflexia bacterium]
MTPPLTTSSPALQHARAIKRVFCVSCPRPESRRSEKCFATADHEGKKFYFCAKECKERFERAPTKFA